ncbi:hypothetical protein P171DRAFT_434462 [Karstenula rhodostoma CBS 690.94]|uniref:Thioredoxin domain-containing protein n=1 Tax=Karstenula rhodostoma CBS 690.94 TaxID=1392251 RepID=A0A9P4PEG8_9PLEO|nr:hypothetical protein P171DRAFT_434462 [Karstenula rhodostoma CBS 690.94]
MMLPSIVRLLWLAASTQAAFANNRTHLWGNFRGIDLDSVIGESSRVLLVFTSQASESIHNHYDFLERLHMDQGLHTRVIMIDCDIDVELCRQYDVNEYPAIRLFERERAKGRFGEDEVTLKRYRGRKTEPAIRSFLLKYEHAVVTDVRDSEHLSEFKKIDDVMIVAYLSEEWSESRRVFLSIADKYYEDFIFGYSQNKKIADMEGVTIPSIVCYKNTDGDHKVLRGDFTEEDVGAFLATAPKMAIGDFSERNMEAYMAVSEQHTTPSYSR